MTLCLDFIAISDGFLPNKTKWINSNDCPDFWNIMWAKRRTLGATLANNMVKFVCKYKSECNG